MDTLESDFAAALHEHELIGNPSRAEEFFAMISAPREESGVARKIKATRNGMLIAVLLCSSAIILGSFALSSVVDPVFFGVAFVLGVIGITVLVVTNRVGRIAPSDIVTVRGDLDLDVAVNAGWLDELPMETIESLDAQGRWDAATFMSKITKEGIPEVGTDYDDPTFEDRFSDARRERTLTYLAERRP